MPEARCERPDAGGLMQEALCEWLGAKGLGAKGLGRAVSGERSGAKAAVHAILARNALVR